jgi:hypothetical protein
MRREKSLEFIRHYVWRSLNLNPARGVYWKFSTMSGTNPDRLPVVKWNLENYRDLITP